MASVSRLKQSLRPLRDVAPYIKSPALPGHLRIAPLIYRESHKHSRDCRRRLHVESAAAQIGKITTNAELLHLPRSCPGCGALTQTVSPRDPGFYTTNRRSVEAFTASLAKVPNDDQLGELDSFRNALDRGDKSLWTQLGLEGGEHQETKSHVPFQKPKSQVTPVCNRCHDLIHHHAGSSVIHPTIHSIQEIISESPHRYNHIYHVLDAADFPLSLIPSLQRHLSLSPQRSLNRRAKTSHFQHGRKAELSFIIARSDLLAPRKEQVDSLMPYLVQVLRDALAGSAENVRLGNVHCVSSKRGWWTKQVKEDIWNRGGGGWMVGKVNVGKSNLFENVFPKGRNEQINHRGLQHDYPEKPHGNSSISPRSHADMHASEEAASRFRAVPEQESIQSVMDSLLPPIQPETPFPVLPVVSALPGTTASPIRIPFGGGKGELIDLPGLPRGDLEDFVVDDHKLDLVMRHRIKPEQFTIKPGQSLLVGGLVRITSTTPDVTLLAYPFVPLKSHVTSTEKAIAIHTQKNSLGISSIARLTTGDRMASAGNYALKWDVTKQRAGPLTRNAAVGLSADKLPFVVLSTDVLIEGCGWIEVVAQIRRKDFDSGAQPGDLFDNHPYPRVEIWSPDGKHIGVRKPMGAWLLGGAKPKSLSKGTVRPRRSMKGVKKALKRAER